MRHSAPLKVAVLVDLEQRDGAGGHVKCWERLAQAALHVEPGRLDLTIFMSGHEERTTGLGRGVRYVTLTPVFSTRRLQMLTGPLPDHTDLSPWHFALAGRLRRGGFDVVHTTDAFFAYARTAERLAPRLGVPLVNSIHTATPELTRLFAEQAVHTVCGRGWLGRLLTERLDVPNLLKRSKLARLARHQAKCAYVFVSKSDEARQAAETLPADRVRKLRRGINRQVFTPAKRDRAWLRARYGIAETTPVALFVGRLDPSKNLSPLVEAVHRTNSSGAGLQLICAGDGRERGGIESRLGSWVTCPGQLAEDELARVYACADLLVMPSEIEETSNVVLEGLASGLPVVVSAAGGMGAYVQPGMTGEVVPSSSPEAWAGVLERLARNPDHLARMRGTVTAGSCHLLPTWEQVLCEDLLPIWQVAAGQTQSLAASPAEPVCQS